MHLKSARFPLLHFLLLTALALSLRANAAYAKSPYELRFLKAKISSAIGEQEVVVLIQVLGAVKDLPPVPDNEIYYRFGQAPELLTSLDADGDGRFLVYGKDLRQKAPLIYHYISDKLDTSAHKDYAVIAFYIKVPPDQDFDHMSLRCTLHPRSSPKLSVRKEFSFAVEQ